jgi:hypothetical protein
MSKYSTCSVVEIMQRHSNSVENHCGNEAKGEIILEVHDTGSMFSANSVELQVYYQESVM